ncbi:MAG: hypothetical protein CBHOC_4587 [uncultured Caballeronia sp.]|nr:MAG: hypothetical protein CBHOC_4587 [uncultured Caballeronia sp.]
MKAVDWMGCRYLMVELNNYAHLKAVYGMPFADEALRALQLRAHGESGSVTDLGSARFLVSFIGKENTSAPTFMLGALTPLENIQVKLANCLVTVGNRSALPVLSIDPVRQGGLGRGGQNFYPEEVEQTSALTAQITMPQSDIKWRLDYERDMGLAVAFKSSSHPRGAQPSNFNPSCVVTAANSGCIRRLCYESVDSRLGQERVVLFPCWSAWDLFVHWTDSSSQRFSVS